MNKKQFEFWAKLLKTDPKRARLRIKINYWLDTRKGYYDQSRIFHLKGRAFETYIEQAEKRYQEAQKGILEKEIKEAIKELKGLEAELKKYFEAELFPALCRIHNQDLKKVAEILKQPQYQEIIDQYEIRSQLHDQYRNEQRRQRSEEGRIRES